MPAQGLIGAKQVPPGPRPDGVEGRPVVERHGHEHGVRLAFADGVAILVAAHDPTVRIDVGGEEGASGLLGGEGAKSYGAGSGDRRHDSAKRDGAGQRVRTTTRAIRTNHHDREHPDNKAPGTIWRVHPATLRVSSAQIRLLPNARTGTIDRTIR